MWKWLCYDEYNLGKIGGKNMPLGVLLIPEEGAVKNSPKIWPYKNHNTVNAVYDSHSGKSLRKWFADSKSRQYFQ